MADLTPNNREEYWLKGMVDGQTTLEPNKRREYWYKEIVDAIGSGGGGGALLVVADEEMTTPPSWVAELPVNHVHETNMTYAQFHAAFISSVLGISIPADDELFFEYRAQPFSMFEDMGEVDGIYQVRVTIHGESTVSSQYLLISNSEDGVLYFVAMMQM